MRFHLKGQKYNDLKAFGISRISIGVNKCGSILLLLSCLYFCLCFNIKNLKKINWLFICIYLLGFETDFSGRHFFNSKTGCKVNTPRTSLNLKYKETGCCLKSLKHLSRICQRQACQWFIS